MEICKEHNLDEFFNLGNGIVYVGCTNCSYWEPFHNKEEVIIEVFDSEEKYETR